MTAERLEEIQEKIDAAKQRKSRAEGAMEKIQQQWQDQYGVKTLEGAQEHLADLKESLKKDETRLQELEGQLEAVTDWDNL